MLTLRFCSVGSWQAFLLVRAAEDASHYRTSVAFMTFSVSPGA